VLKSITLIGHMLSFSLIAFCLCLMRMTKFWLPVVGTACNVGKNQHLIYGSCAGSTCACCCFDLSNAFAAAAGLCLGPCTAEPLVCDDDSCCRVRVSSSTASDCLTISMPAASMGLSMIAAKHQQLEQHHQHMHHITAAAAAAAAANDAFMGVLPPEADTALQPSGCAADLGCSCMGGGCLGCGRLSAAVLPEPAPVPPCGITPAAAAGQLGNGSTAFESAMGVPDEAVGGETAEGSDGIGGGELDPSELGDLRGCCVVEGDVRVLVRTVCCQRQLLMTSLSWLVKPAFCSVWCSQVTAVLYLLIISFANPPC
jgi:hypothetical protein